MGRDFMFSTFGIMNKIVCFTIHQPVVSNKPLPVAISYSTPAFIGAFTGVNAHVSFVSFCQVYCLRELELELTCYLREMTLLGFAGSTLSC